MDSLTKNTTEVATINSLADAHKITTVKRKMRRSKQRMKRNNPVKQLLRIFYRCLILSIVAVVVMMLWEIFTTYYEGSREQEHKQRQSAIVSESTVRLG